MGDRTWAQLEIGGDIARDRVGDLAALLDEEFGRGNGDGVFAEQIEAAAAAGESLSYEDWEANYGRFSIEAELAALGLSYDVRWNSGVEFSEGEDRFRPGMDAARGFQTNGGEVVVSGDMAGRAIEMIEQGKCDEALGLLRHALGKDVVGLPPLRIVEA